jgi:hypothetical protein
MGNLCAQYDPKRRNPIEHDSLSEETESTIREKSHPNCGDASGQDALQQHHLHEMKGTGFMTMDISILTSWQLCTDLSSFKWSWATSRPRSLTNISSKKRHHWAAASTLEPSEACTACHNQVYWQTNSLKNDWTNTDTDRTNWSPASGDTTHGPYNSY